MINFKVNVFLFLLFVTLNTFGATIAIIDSGTDMGHEAISPYAWNNPIDIPQNNRDEDGNGYQDDFYGWNFAESNNQVIDYSYLGLLNEDIEKFFDIQAKMMVGEASDEEMSWLRKMVSNEDFIKRLSVYGNFMHGTHVARIAARKTLESKLIAIKLIPTEVKLPVPADGEEKFISLTSGLKDKLIKFSLRKLAEQQMKLLKEISEYVKFHEANVANGSFGTGFAQAKMLIKTVAEALKLDLTTEEVEKYSKYFISELITNGNDMVAISPSTLFVFAAGNDGSDNDNYPTSPANIRADNVVTVAATVGYGQLAPFSNYGKTTVDVAAPGYAIESAVPGDKYLKVSGTSQAAPYVAGVAGKMLEANKSLSSSSLKRIILETVDKKDYLEGKVLSSGVINSMRAVRAAELSMFNSLDESINMAHQEVRDNPVLKKQTELVKVPVMPLPSIFTF